MAGSTFTPIHVTLGRRGQSIREDEAVIMQDSGLYFSFPSRD